MGKTKGSPDVDTPLKGQISRHYQSLGGASVRGAASATARTFKLKGSAGASKVKTYDQEVKAGTASRSGRRAGRRTSFDDVVAQDIDEAFLEDDTMTYREAAAKLDLPKSTLHRFATKDMDFRCLGHTVRPLPTEANLAKRVEMAHGICSTVGPFKDEFHQDEKYCICDSGRRKRKARKSNKEALAKATYRPSRRHQTQVMATRG